MKGKTLGIIAIIILVIILLYIWFRMIYDRITFEFGFRGADVSNLDINALLLGGQTDATIKMSAKAVNKNNFDITFSDLRAWLTYEGLVIAQTSEELAKQKITVPKNSAAEVVDNVKILLNRSAVKLLKEVVLKKSPKVQYTVKLKIFGIPVSWNDYFIWEM